MDESNTPRPAEESRLPVLLPIVALQDAVVLPTALHPQTRAEKERAYA